MQPLLLSDVQYSWLLRPWSDATDYPRPMILVGKSVETRRMAKIMMLGLILVRLVGRL
jgi:hypothetical protein